MNAAAIVRQARQDAGLTQTELAELAQMKQSEIARLESPGANPRFQTLSRVMHAAGSRLELSKNPPSSIDPTRIASSLRESPELRFQRFEGLSEFVCKYAGAAQRSRG